MTAIHPVTFPAGTKKLNGDIAREGEVHRITRGLLAIELELPYSMAADSRTCTNNPITSCSGNSHNVIVAVTHLDHISIDERRTQLRHVVSLMKSETIRGAPVILAGDFNALTRFAKLICSVDRTLSMMHECKHV